MEWLGACEMQQVEQDQCHDICVMMLWSCSASCIFRVLSLMGILECFPASTDLEHIVKATTFVDGYCSTVQGLLDWFEVDLGFT